MPYYRSPSEYTRRVFIATIGETPQVATETLYTLIVNQDQPFIPTEIHFITTARGEKEIQNRLLHKKDGKLKQFIQDYKNPELSLDSLNNVEIHVIKNSDGNPLDDITTTEHNDCLADMTVQLVNDLCKDEDNTIVHASIAGGRKTMTFYLAEAMGYFARYQDTLSHIIMTSHEFESSEVFYPAPKKCIINHKRRNGDTVDLDSSKAEVTLAMLNFSKDRYLFPIEFFNGKQSYQDIVTASEIQKHPINLTYDFSNQELYLSGKKISMEPGEMVCYIWIAWRKFKLEEYELEVNQLMLEKKEVETKQNEQNQENVELNDELEALNDKLEELNHKAEEFYTNYGLIEWDPPNPKEKIRIHEFGRQYLMFYCIGFCNGQFPTTNSFIDMQKAFEYTESDLKNFSSNETNKTNSNKGMQSKYIGPKDSKIAAAIKRQLGERLENTYRLKNPGKKRKTKPKPKIFELDIECNDIRFINIPQGIKSVEAMEKAWSSYYPRLAHYLKNNR